MEIQGGCEILCFSYLWDFIIDVAIRGRILCGKEKYNCRIGTNIL